MNGAMLTAFKHVNMFLFSYPLFEPFFKVPFIMLSAFLLSCGRAWGVVDHHPTTVEMVPPAEQAFSVLVQA